MLQHPVQREGEIDDADEVDIDRGAPVGDVDLRAPRDSRPDDSGVVHEDVDGTECVENGADRALHRAVVTDIGRDDERAPAELAGPLGDLGELVARVCEERERSRRR